MIKWKSVNIFLGGGVKTMTMTMTRGCDDNDKVVWWQTSPILLLAFATLSLACGGSPTHANKLGLEPIFLIFFFCSLFSLLIYVLFCCTLPELIFNADDNLNFPQFSQQSNVSLFMESPHWFSYSNPIHSCGCISSSTFVVSSLNAHNPLVGQASQAVSRQLGFSEEGKAAPLFLAQGRWT